MNDERPLQVGMLCNPRLTQLDLTGPYEVLARMPNTPVHILWKDKAPVKTESGLLHRAHPQLARVNKSGHACGTRRTWPAGLNGKLGARVRNC